MEATGQSLGYGPGGDWSSRLGLSPEQRRQAVVDIIVSGLMRLPKGLDLVVDQAAHGPHAESAESSRQAADQT